MLNISNNRVSEYIDLKSFKSGKNIFKKDYHKRFRKFLLAFSIILIITLFLPWTQNITSKGSVTTLKPNQRPQTLQSQIPGRIEIWYVQEGDFVKKGDTILRISEIKSDYFDDKLTERTDDQLKSDSIDLEATKIKADIAKTQYERAQILEKEGLKAVKDVEEKRSKLQEADAKLVSQNNKFLSSKNKIINEQLNITTIDATYADKIAKAQSNLYTAQSSGYDTAAEVSKLETNLANYKKRSSLLFVTAPQDGFINKAIKSGIGETFKEGEKLVSIMPANYDLAVEMYVRPLDLPLIHIDESVRVQFDGWPAIVFSGWPNVSYGTYGAKVVAIENYISENGMYRVLITPDSKDVNWPKAIRVGSGAKTISLLDNVPIWFELWRQINSFPPNFYQPNSKKIAQNKN